jgi:hypothetical protein
MHAPLPFILNNQNNEHMKSMILKTAWKPAKKIVVMGLVSVLLFSCDKEDNDYGSETPPAAASVLAVAGDSATIIGTINQFRTLLGDPQNTTPNQTSGRREIRWDGVPATFTNTNTFPVDFFNNTDPAAPNGRKTGLVYTNTNATFRVDSTDFAEFKDAKITRLEITSGSGVLSAGVKDVSDGGSKDLVVMDDFLYDEPAAN